MSKENNLTYAVGDNLYYSTIGGVNECVICQIAQTHYGYNVVVSWAENPEITASLPVRALDELERNYHVYTSVEAATQYWERHYQQKESEYKGGIPYAKHS